MKSPANISILSKATFQASKVIQLNLHQINLLSDPNKVDCRQRPAINLIGNGSALGSASSNTLTYLDMDSH